MSNNSRLELTSLRRCQRTESAAARRMFLVHSTTLECGCKLPVIADACQSYKEIMPVGIGMIGDRIVLVLRDTGCSTSSFGF